MLGIFTFIYLVLASDDQQQKWRLLSLAPKMITRLEREVSHQSGVSATLIHSWRWSDSPLSPVTRRDSGHWVVTESLRGLTGRSDQHQTDWLCRLCGRFYCSHPPVTPPTLRKSTGGAACSEVTSSLLPCQAGEGESQLKVADLHQSAVWRLTTAHFM